MIANYYTLQALVREWKGVLNGCIVGDVFSQERDELSLTLAGPEGEKTFRLSVASPLRYLYCSEGHHRARRNVAGLFEEAVGLPVTALRLAERERIVYFDLAGGGRIQLMLFGPRANAFLVDAEGMIREAFQDDGVWRGLPAPEAQPAPEVASFSDFETRWRTDRRTTEQAVASAFPLFDRLLAAEVLHRAGVTAAKPGACAESDRRAIFEAAVQVRAELQQPRPRIYWSERFADVFSLIRLGHRQEQAAETFDAVDAAVRVSVRKSLGQQHFQAVYVPLEQMLASAATHYRESAARMLESLSGESRAGRYEHWAHLLMASASQAPAGAVEISLPDLFAAGEPVTIPLDPSLSAVENAEQFYERARRTRQSREHAERRLVETEQRAIEAEALLGRLREINTLTELETFRKAEAERLLRFGGGNARAETAQIPFRRFLLPGGYEVWVGKNAKQNDLLTFRYAQKYDLWMHARGAAGSHAVLRLPNRQAAPGKRLLEQAASIAAYFSKARGSGLVPVIVAERKFVRKPRGAAPGAVVVERESVLLVEPRLPAAASEA